MTHDRVGFLCLLLRILLPPEVSLDSLSNNIKPQLLHLQNGDQMLSTWCLSVHPSSLYCPIPGAGARQPLP